MTGDTWARVRVRVASWAGGPEVTFQKQLAEIVTRVEEAAAQTQSVRRDVLLLQQRQRYSAICEVAQRAGWDSRDLAGFEMGVFSQNGEDGVLQEILRRIGGGSGYFVEIGAHAWEANCLLLADVLGWSGCFFECDNEQVVRLQRKYAGAASVAVVHARVDAANINRLLDASGVPSTPDVLSIDVDGNDYWLWRGLRGRRPRVIVIEYNAAIPGDLARVQPYEPDAQWDGTAFFGASRSAMVDLARAKGYRLVHCDLAGVNLFFVRNDLVGSAFLPEEQVVARPVNYMLAAELHAEPRSNRRYVEPPLLPEPDRALS